MSDLPKLEFRSPSDEAWYGVDVRNEDDALVVSYDGFSSETDELYTPKYFESNEEIDEFEKRFRPISIQMKDEDCPNLADNTKVCASCTCVNDELKFYDAYVIVVEREEHDVDEEGNEVCKCEFKLSWLHGPCIYRIATAKVADITLIQENHGTDPRIETFLEEVRRIL